MLWSPDNQASRSIDPRLPRSVGVGVTGDDVLHGGVDGRPAAGPPSATGRWLPTERRRGRRPHRRRGPRPRRRSFGRRSERTTSPRVRPVRRPRAGGGRAPCGPGRTSSRCRLPLPGGAAASVSQAATCSALHRPARALRARVPNVAGAGRARSGNLHRAACLQPMRSPPAAHPGVVPRSRSERNRPPCSGQPGAHSDRAPHRGPNPDHEHERLHGRCRLPARCRSGCRPPERSRVRIGRRPLPIHHLSLRPTRRLWTKNGRRTHQPPSRSATGGPPRPTATTTACD